MNRLHSHCQKGFTLIEMITVMVVLSIISVIGVQFVASTMESYTSTLNRGKLIAHGRQALERISRQLRIALPNSVRIVGTGNQCVEFLPIIAGGNYIDPVPDNQNGMAETDSIDTGAYQLSTGAVKKIYIGALTASEIYSGSLVGKTVSSTSATSVTFTSAHRFLRNSVTQRFYLTDDPAAFCIDSGVLVYYSGYTTAGSPSGSPVIIAEGISAATPFSLSLGSEDRNSLLSVELTFSRAGESVVLNQEIFVRNVP